MRTLISAALLFVVVVGASSQPTAPNADAVGLCSSDRERLAIGEVLSRAIGCKATYPDLQVQIDETLKPLRQAYAECFAQYEHTRRGREALEIAIGMGSAQLRRDKTQSCVTELRDAVEKTQTLPGK